MTTLATLSELCSSFHLMTSVAFITYERLVGISYLRTGYTLLLSVGISILLANVVFKFFENPSQCLSTREGSHCFVFLLLVVFFDLFEMKYIDRENEDTQKNPNAVRKIPK